MEQTWCPSNSSTIHNKQTTIKKQSKRQQTTYKQKLHSYLRDPDKLGLEVRLYLVYWIQKFGALYFDRYFDGYQLQFWSFWVASLKLNKKQQLKFLIEKKDNNLPFRTAAILDFYIKIVLWPEHHI